MIWFCSDNGPEGEASDAGSTRDLRGRKRSLYEGGIRVPGLLIWPQMVKANRIVTMPCSTSDYFPTILEVIQPSTPEATVRPGDGISLLPLIQGAMTTRPRPIAFQSGRQIALVDNRWKLISLNDGVNYQLYDLISDPGESIDQAAANPAVVSAMKEQLAAWQASCKQSAQGKDYP